MVPASKQKAYEKSKAHAAPIAGRRRENVSMGSINPVVQPSGNAS
jgi:hypothetical protein